MLDRHDLTDIAFASVKSSPGHINVELHFANEN